MGCCQKFAEPFFYNLPYLITFFFSQPTSPKASPMNWNPNILCARSPVVYLRHFGLKISELLINIGEQIWRQII